MYEYKEDELGVYIFYKHSKTITFKEIKETFIRIQNDTLLPRKLRILEDSGNVEIQINSNNFHEIKDEISNLFIKFDAIFHATYSENPVIIAHAILLEEELIGTNYRFKSFSLEENAKKWLKETFISYPI